MSLKIFIHDHQQQSRLAGRSLPGDTKLFRLKLVSMMAKANMSTRSMEDIKQVIEMLAGQTGGSRRQLNDYWAIHHHLWEEHLKKFICNCMFNQFGIIVDGTPSFAPAEGFKLRAVSKEWDIVEVLLRVTLLAKGPDAQGLANSVSKVMDDFELQIKKLRTAIKDRAATNQVAVNLMPAHHGIQVFALGKAIQHGVNCPLRFREIFVESPKKGRGVRFYVYLEQCVQLHHVGLAKLHDSIINH